MTNNEAKPQRNLSIELGRISWLWMNSPLHRNWPVHLLAQFSIPPIELSQYVLLERDGFPVAYCSWAFMDKETEIRYLLNPSGLARADWRSGDRLWFIDWIAPFSSSDSFKLKDLLANRFPDSIARAIRVKAQKKNARVMEFIGRRLERVQAQNVLTEYHIDFLTAYAK